MTISRILASAVAGALAAPTLAAASPPAPEPTFAAEKCYGINVRGRNDCAQCDCSVSGVTESPSVRPGNPAVSK